MGKYVSESGEGLQILIYWMTSLMDDPYKEIRDYFSAMWFRGQPFFIFSASLGSLNFVITMRIRERRELDQSKFSILILFDQPRLLDPDQQFSKAPIIFPDSLQKIESTQSPYGQQIVSPKMIQLCMNRCKFQTTSEYNPVCGSDDKSYDNRRFLDCAQRCGKSSSESVNWFH